MTEYKVPRILWENLESVLLEQSKRFVRELAKRLDVPEKELIKRVLPSDKLQVTIMDSDCASLQCKAFIQQHKMTIYCRKPVAYQSGYCLSHRYKRMDVLPFDPKPVQRIKGENLWVHDSMIYNDKGEVVGRVCHKKNKIKRFII
jgi:hypothetical protein